MSTLEVVGCVLLGIGLFVWLVWIEWNHYEVER